MEKTAQYALIIWKKLVFDPEVLKNLLLLIPLSIIGLWRWSFWIVRRVCATLYRPNPKPWPKNILRPRVNLITPVYNEDTIVFEEAMQSWIRNGVDEIVAVIDKSNTRHIVDFERRYVCNDSIQTKCRLLVTPKPGKRAALCDGLEFASGDIMVLVDSDTIWDDGLLEKTIPYFTDPKVGGATVSQRIQNPNTVANVMFDILLWSRYKEEVPFLMSVGNAFNTLSGRTAFYRREAIFSDEHDNIHHLRHEFFMGSRGISGDDKRLTHLILQQGWQTAYVVGPVVHTPGLNSVKKFLKQRLRWTRNSWRADLRAVGKGWVWSHPALAVFMIDRFFQPLVMLLGPVVMAFAIINKEWFFAGILLGWWLISRFIKIFGYFKKYPKRIIYLPAYIIYGYLNAVMKIYALATLVENSWATRWHKNRAKRKNIFRKGFTLLSGYTAIIVFVAFMGVVVVTLRQQTGASIAVPAAVDQVAFSAQVDGISKLQEMPPIHKIQVNPSAVNSYILQPGDTIESLSLKFGMSVADLKKLNNLRNINKVSAGETVIYYKGSIKQ